jgi:hypothetical protein
VGVAVEVGAGVPVGLLVAVLVGVAELVAVAAGLEGAGLDDVVACWLGGGASVAVAEAAGVGEGASVAGTAEGLPVATAALATGSTGGAAAAIMIPVTIAAMPPRTPAASSNRVQEDAWGVSGGGPSDVMGASQGLDPHGRHPSRHPVAGRRPPQG